MAAASMMPYRSRDGFQHDYQHSYAYYQQRAQTHVAPTLVPNPYSAYQPMATQYQPSARSSQSTASSPVDEGNKPSLPSISNLLGIADGDRATQDNAAQAQAQQIQQQQVQLQQAQLQQAEQAAQALEQRSRNSYHMSELSSSQRTAIPPTPPLRSDSVVEGTHSPSTISTGSSISAPPYFLGSSLNNMEPHEQRVAAATQFIKRQSVTSHPSTSPYGTSPYNSSPYTTSPGAVSNGSFYSPDHNPYPPSGMYQQRPLPSSFPPPAPVTVTPNLPTANPWEHHHYISASSQATFPQSQDRYICQTCNKAFSRPSSLKIHSHSHTGEKPFKCPHSGCGKAFSVRSNMKRHERGCHTGMVGAHS